MHMVLACVLPLMGVSLPLELEGKLGMWRGVPMSTTAQFSVQTPWEAGGVDLCFPT